jgi:hypothetical protein
VATPTDLSQRMWRMRKRHQAIDATLAASDGVWELTFWRNRKPMLMWRYADQDEARSEAERRRGELERSGWTSHW